MLVAFLSDPDELEDALIAGEVARQFEVLTLVADNLAATWETAVIARRTIRWLERLQILLMRSVTDAHNAATRGRGLVDPPGDSVTRAWGRFVMHGPSLGATAG